MATYCISDIHGNRDAFHRLLKKIQFEENDTLYILGDVIDRGQRGIALLQEIMNSSNMKMLLGNHEYMMLQYFNPSQAARTATWERNGNRHTLASFLGLRPSEQQDVLFFLRILPTHLDVAVGERKYHLVHGFPGNTIRVQVWGRPMDIHVPNPIPDRTLLIGHTPVVLLETENEAQQEHYFRALEKGGAHMRILHAPGGWIDLDCGCSYPVSGAALGCLRLDDIKEFYIREKEETK